MVRIKQRYLLIQLLYPSNFKPAPEPAQEPGKSAASTDAELRSTQLAKLYSPSPDTLDAPTLLRLIRNSIRTLYGEHGAAIAGGSLSLKYWSQATSMGILRCRREVFRMVWGAVTWLREVELGGQPGPDGARGGFRGGRGSRGRGRGATISSSNNRYGQSNRRSVEVVVRVLRCSGTIRKCEEEAIQWSRKIMGRVKGLKDAELAGAEMRHLGSGIGGAGLAGEEEEGGEAPPSRRDDMTMGLGSVDDEDGEEDEDEEE